MSISGVGGKVRIGTNDVTELSNWSLDVEADTLDITHFGNSGWAVNAAGGRSWSGFFEGTWNVANDDNGQKVLQDAMFAGTIITLELYVDDTHKYTGQAILTGMSVETAADDWVTISFDFQGTGPLSYQ
ncbi:hypothetical protein BSNK01_28340 [Bacillaceae bacterium]